MPKFKVVLREAVHVVGLKRVPSGTRFTLSDGTVLESRLLTTIGWCPIIKETPIFFINEKQYVNKVPRVQMGAWKKADLIFCGASNAS